MKKKAPEVKWLCPDKFEDRGFDKKLCMGCEDRLHCLTVVDKNRFQMKVAIKYKVPVKWIAVNFKIADGKRKNRASK